MRSWENEARMIGNVPFPYHRYQKALDSDFQSCYKIFSMGKRESLSDESCEVRRKRMLLLIPANPAKRNWHHTKPWEDKMSIKKVQMCDDREDAFFQKQDKEKLLKLREKATEETDKKYRDEHRGHCFRCGTESLVEVEKGNLKIDICVNKDCGAVHLDPGELDAIIKDQGVIGSVRTALFNVFK